MDIFHILMMLLLKPKGHQLAYECSYLRVLIIMLNLIRMITALRSMTIQAVSAQLRSQELISCHSEVMQVYSQRNRLRKKLQDAWAVVQQSLMRTSA